jgi:hypothetical protein
VHPLVPSCLESNQHLLRFRQAPSPDRLRGQCCGRGGARPRASSTIRLSESTFGAQRSRSGTRSRTSTNRVKTCRSAVSRSPSCGVPGRGFEPRQLRSERSGLPLADPGSRGSAGSRTPFARLRAECFAIKASDPHVRLSREPATGSRTLPRDGSDEQSSPSPTRLLPPVGLEPTHAGLKGRYPTSWVTAAHVCRRLVCECGSGRTRTCDGRWAQTGLQPVSFAARMHAPPTMSRNNFPVS